ncbi:MAG: branched-chain amino acid transport system II carrier protein [Firmicutes bacterium]|nr:branched-chain amino acid transport system II carrier protein [Bacillota bacterium]
MKHKADIKTIIILGLACFANYFGAGNLIFPPYLGLTTGKSWFIAFLLFILVDAGLAVLCLVASARKGNGFTGVVDRLGSKLTPVVLFANALCLGPLIAVPRTAATTYSLTFTPLFPGVSSWLVSGVFMAVVAFLCLKPSKVVDAIGQYMAPILVVGLAILVAKGVFVLADNPIIGDIGTVPSLKEGLTAGYQTMDMLGSALFCSMLLISLDSKNIDENDRVRTLSLAGVVAFVCLFSVYMGICFLGVKVTGQFTTDITQAELLVAITDLILGKAGTVLLGIIVLLACMTTAVGLTSSCADTFRIIFRKEDKYPQIVVLCCLLSFVLANIGLSNIIALAAPILEVLYPVILICVVMSFFPEEKRFREAAKVGALIAAGIAIYTQVDLFTAASLGSASLPLYDLGLSWVLPAAAGTVLNLLVTKDRKA